jgi:hypothetical protein
MKAGENQARETTERGYNGRDAVRILRASVEATNNREELRLIDSQLTQLLRQVREKMRGRKASR